MTADPRVIKEAYTINELSYAEAMELSNFGAKGNLPANHLSRMRKKHPHQGEKHFQPYGKRNDYQVEDRE